MKKTEKVTTDFKWNQIIGISAFENVTEFEDLPQGGPNEVNFLMVTKGEISCLVRKKASRYTERDMFVIHPFESWEVEIVQAVSGYLVSIDQDSLFKIVGENKKINESIKLTEDGLERLLSLLTESIEKYREYNNYQQIGFINNFIGVLSEENLFKEDTEVTDTLFDKVKRYIEEHYNEDLSLSFLAQKFGYNAKYFSTAFNKLFGVKLRTYINYIRVKKSLEIAKKIGGCYTIDEVIFCSGFNSRETYYRALKKYKQDIGSAQELVGGENGSRVKKQVAIVGYGNRGQVYGDYALDMPEEMEVIGVVDPNKYKQGIAKERYGLSDSQLFDSLEEFLKVHPKCDLVINATMDQLHYSTAIDILNAGYDMMLEKPIVNNTEELFEIERVAKQNNCKVFVCHVLRYAPYYRAIKDVINSGEIGEIMTIEMNEHVCTPHYLTSFDRGKWRSEDISGSGFLLAKCCHDLDLMCWLNSDTVPHKVASIGSRSQFVREKMPQGATEFCFDCPYERGCQYSAFRQYMDLKAMPFLVWDSFNKPYEEITDEEKIEFLRKDNYGRCAYIAGGNLLDRQSVVVTFENGSCCTFMLVGGSLKAERGIRIVGTHGEIEGKLSEEKFSLRKFDKNTFDGSVQIIDLKGDVLSTARINAHNGGDFAIMHDVIGYLNGIESPSISELENSIDGYLCVFAAEKARKEERIVKIDEIKDKNQ
ncbi:MAG: Gfo/Idh/MocA family oxidoreductase [Clostridia bacterium]|nr:Gfo/Idh/MocA family oxidoreductase [Clostridia bacterium]